MNRMHVRLPMLALLVVWAGGCGSSNQPSLYPVQGKVLVDGQPAANIMVRFNPLGDTSPFPLVSQGLTAGDGTFTLSTHQTGDGAPAGQYAVTFQWFDLRVDKDGENTFTNKDKLGGRYKNPASSTHKVTVPLSNNEQLTFNLSRSH